MALSLFEKKSAAKTEAAVSFRAKAAGRPVFAFDFGEYSIKVAMVKLRRGEVEIRNLFTVENKENLAKLDNQNAKNWRALLQRAFSVRSIITDDHIAVCTFGGKYYIHRQIEIPYVENVTDRNGVVAAEMSQLLALDVNAYVFQHELLSVNEEKEDGKTCTVWAIAMPKELCTAVFELLKALKMKPLIMDIHANGMKRLLSADASLRKETRGWTVACIDYGMTHTDLLFFNDGAFINETVLDLGDTQLVQAARGAAGVRITDPTNANKIVVSPQDICNILNRTHTTAEERAFAQTVKDWLSKVNTAITRFNFDHADNPVREILLYGGSPQNYWLAQYVESVVGIPTKLITDTSLYNTENVAGDEGMDISAYLNVLNLSLMD